MTDAIDPTRRVLVLNFGPPNRKLTPPPPVPANATAVVEKTQPCNRCWNLGQLASQVIITATGDRVEVAWVPHAVVYEFTKPEDAATWVTNVAASSFDVVTYLNYP